MDARRVASHDDVLLITAFLKYSRWQRDILERSGAPLRIEHDEPAMLGGTPDPAAEKMTRPSRLRRSEFPGGAPKFPAELRRNFWRAKFPCGPPQKNLGGQIPPRSSEKKFGRPDCAAKLQKKFGAPNFPAELQKKFQRAKSAGGGLNFFAKLQIRLRGVVRQGIGRKGGPGRFRRR